MTRQFQFRELTLYGPTSHFSYTFVPGVNLILGPVGSGKTSLLELLKYALGGAATLSPAVRDAVHAAAVSVVFEERSVVLLREVGSRSVKVHSVDGVLLGTYSVDAGRTEPPVSDLLLELLKIPALRVPRSRRRPTSASSRLSFFDVYSYLYLNQTEIDRSVVSHLDSYREPKRRATFELLYGLSNATLLDLEVQRGELREELASEQRRADHIRTFLAAAGQPDVDQLRRKREHAVASAEAAEARLRALQDGVRSASQDADPSRLLLAELQALQDHDRAHLSAAVVGVERLRSLAAQLELDAQRVAKSLSADKVLSGLEYKVCPRCLQRVDARRADDGACYVCLQPEDIVELRAQLHVEGRRVDQQLSETLGLVADDEAQVAAIQATVDERADLIARVRHDIDENTKRFVSPRFAEIEDTAGEVGGLRSLVADLDKTAAMWERYGAIEVRIREIEATIAQIEGLLAENRASLAEGNQRVATLSALFAETLEQFHLPWLERARIDPKSYLPIVNDRSFEELSSGGMKTLVNDAYHLAALRYALVYADSLLPLLQVMDSPRKNLGSGPEDRALSTNLYRRIRAMQDAFGDTFQMIVADNDAPAVAADFPTISLSYQHPSVPFLTHPGPDLVDSIGGASSAT